MAGLTPAPVSRSSFAIRAAFGGAIEKHSIYFNFIFAVGGSDKVRFKDSASFFSSNSVRELSL